MTLGLANSLSLFFGPGSSIERERGRESTWERSKTRGETKKNSASAWREKKDLYICGKRLNIQNKCTLQAWRIQLKHVIIAQKMISLHIYIQTHTAHSTYILSWHDEEKCTWNCAYVWHFMCARMFPVCGFPANSMQYDLRNAPHIQTLIGHWTLFLGHKESNHSSFRR